MILSCLTSWFHCHSVVLLPSTLRRMRECYVFTSVCLDGGHTLAHWSPASGPWSFQRGTPASDPMSFPGGGRNPKTAPRGTSTSQDRGIPGQDRRNPEQDRVPPPPQERDGCVTRVVCLLQSRRRTLWFSIISSQQPSSPVNSIVFPFCRLRDDDDVHLVDVEELSGGDG